MNLLTYTQAQADVMTKRQELTQQSEMI